MCVIAFSAVGARLTRADLQKMFIANRDGAGLAWAENDGRITVRRGMMTFADLVIAYEALPETAAWMLHCRMATVGGVSPTLTHPFLITAQSPTAHLSYVTRTPVLAHNGHVTEWRTLGALSRKVCRKKDDSPWTDSRLIARLVALAGKKILDTLAERVAILYPSGVIRYWGGSWSETAPSSGIYVSNTNWRWTTYVVNTVADENWTRYLKYKEEIGSE